MGTRIQKAYGVGGPLLDVFPVPILAQRAPATSDTNYPVGQIWVDQSVSPFVIYTHLDDGDWAIGGNELATQTIPGIVEIATYAELSTGTAPAANYVGSANDVFTYVNSVAIAGAPAWSESVSGIGQLSTLAEAAAGANDTTAMTPLKVATALISSLPITGGAGSFTTLAASGLASLSGSATITTGATTLNLASDASTGAVNIGTGAGARAITIGNVTAGTGVTINTGTGHFTVNTTGAGDIILNSDDTMLLDSDGVLELNSSAGVISIGNDADAQNINIGTGGAARTITIGNSTGATSVVINSGTGAIDIGANAVAHSITIGNNIGATSVVIDSGTGAINIGTAIAKVITIGNTTGATGIIENVGTGNYVLDGVTGSTYTVGASTTTGTITIGGTAQTGDIVLGSSSGINALRIGNGSGATTLSLCVVQLGGAINMGTAMTTGTITVGGTGAQTGTVSLAPGTGAQIVNIATGGTGAKTVNIATGAIGNIVTIGTVTAAASMSLLVGTGNFSLDGAPGSIYTIGASTTTGTITIGGTAQTGTITLGSSSGINIVAIGAGEGATTVNIAGGATAAKAVNIATGAVANVITIGTVSGAASISLLVGTGNFSLNGAATSNYTFAPSTTSGTINFGGTGANTGTVTILGGTGVQTCNIMASTGVKTLNIGTGAAANVITIGTTDTSASLNLQSGSGNVSVTGGHLAIASVARTLLVNGGAVTDFVGTGVLTAGTQTIANTNIATGDVILLTRTAVNASVTLGLFTYTIINATSFTVTSVTLGTPAVTQVADVSSYSYFIVRPT